MAEPSREERSHALLRQLRAPEEIGQDWAGFILDTVLDGVWERPALPPKTRSMITIAALTALHRPNELELHIKRGLAAGLSRTEISEIIMHMAVYGGFPVAVEGMRIAREVFDAADVKASART
jgi:4-carboxymuconolactone decarboxylase